MDGFGNNVSAAGGSVPSAPPPPPEVKVRTMRSDLAAMAKSGGGLPRFESVPVAGLSLETKGDAAASAVAKGKSGTMTAVILIAALAIFAILGYVAYRFFYNGSTAAPTGGTPAASVPPTQPASAGNLGAAASTTAQPSSTAPAPFIHTSFFKKPADQTLILTLSSAGAASSAADLATFSQKLSALLTQANKNAQVIEVVVQTADHHGVPIGDLLTKENAAVLDPQFLAAHFNADATFFVYQDKNGFWPAYVLSLKPSENWLFLKNDVAKLETSPNIPNLFLANVGTPAAGGFVDSAINGTAVRMVSLITPASNTNAVPQFLYGWYQTYLIMSTSPGGFTAALTRL